MNTMIVVDFNTSLTSLEISSRQKINKATAILNGDTIDQLTYRYLYRTFCLKAAECIFFQVHVVCSL